MRSFLSLAVVSFVAADKCTSWKSSSPEATFDLSPLTKKGGYFAKDTYVRASRPFDYYFNLCGSVPYPDKICEEWEDMQPVAAFQLENATSNTPAKCIALGKKNDVSYKLLHEDGSNAAVGVQVVFEKGAKCNKEGESNRKFAINVRCVKEKTTLNFLSSVSEDLDNGCEYEVDMYSIHGCPTECHSTSHDKLCSGHGVCAIDTEANKARCFCNAEWGGPDCAEAQSGGGPSSASVNTTLMVLTMLLLVALLVLSYVLYGKIKALNADDVPYNALDTEAGSGQM